MAIAKGGQTTKRDLLPAASSLKQSRALFWHSVMKACDRGRTWEAAALIKSKKSSQGRKEGLKSFPQPTQDPKSTPLLVRLANRCCLLCCTCSRFPPRSRPSSARNWGAKLACNCQECRPIQRAVGYLSQALPGSWPSSDAPEAEAAM
jgi:hypothetical protein